MIASTAAGISSGSASAIPATSEVIIWTPQFISPGNASINADVMVVRVSVIALVISGVASDILLTTAFSTDTTTRSSSGSIPLIVDSSFDPSFGARPLKRYIQRNVETIVAKEILADKVRQGDTITIDEQNGELSAVVNAG